MKFCYLLNRRFCSATDWDKEDHRFNQGFSRMMLEGNAHFSGIPVNTSFSSVHVPTNVFDGGRVFRIQCNGPRLTFQCFLLRSEGGERHQVV